MCNESTGLGCFNLRWSQTSHQVVRMVLREMPPFHSTCNYIPYQHSFINHQSQPTNNTNLLQNKKNKIKIHVLFMSITFSLIRVIFTNWLEKWERHDQIPWLESHFLHVYKLMASVNTQLVWREASQRKVLQMGACPHGGFILLLL